MRSMNEDNWALAPGASEKRLSWEEDDSFEGVVFRAVVGDDEWFVRVNDFPDEPAFTLFFGEEMKLHFNNWPAPWTRPW